MNNYCLPIISDNLKNEFRDDIDFQLIKQLDHQLFLKLNQSLMEGFRREIYWVLDEDINLEL